MFGLTSCFWLQQTVPEPVWWFFCSWYSVYSPTQISSYQSSLVQYVCQYIFRRSFRSPAGKTNIVTNHQQDQHMLCFGAGLCWFFQQSQLILVDQYLMRETILIIRSEAWWVMRPINNPKWVSSLPLVYLWRLIWKAEAETVWGQTDQDRWAQTAEHRQLSTDSWAQTGEHRQLSTDRWAQTGEHRHTRTDKDRQEQTDEDQIKPGSVQTSCTDRSITDWMMILETLLIN